MHDSILPHLAQPTLMIDFLTSACDVGEWDFHLGYWARGTHSLCMGPAAICCLTFLHVTVGSQSLYRLATCIYAHYSLTYSGPG